LLPGSGLTFGLPLLVRLTGVSCPSFRFVSDTDVMAKSDLQISDYANPDKRGRDNRNRHAQHFFRHFR
jgi:hypothetical protein